MYVLYTFLDTFPVYCSHVRRNLHESQSQIAVAAEAAISVAVRQPLVPVRPHYRPAICHPGCREAQSCYDSPVVSCTNTEAIENLPGEIEHPGTTGPPTQSSCVSDRRNQTGRS